MSDADGDQIDQILQAFLQESVPMIERVVSRALRDGRKVSELAFDLERGLDEKIRGGCAPRAEVAKRWRSHPEIDDVKRNEIADLILETGPNAVPVVITILVDRFKIFGVKRLEGDAFATGKPN